MANRAAFLVSEKGKFAVENNEIWQPGESELLVKVHAAAIQPADEKIARTAALEMEYLCVLGGPIAGTVEALGIGAHKSAVGGRVVFGTQVLGRKKAMYGGLQRYTVVDESEIVEIGDIDFAKATTLGSYTPPGAFLAARH